MSYQPHIAAQIAAVDCRLTCDRIIKLLDKPKTRAQVPDEIKELQKNYARLLLAHDDMEKSQ